MSIGEIKFRGELKGLFNAPNTRNHKLTTHPPDLRIKEKYAHTKRPHQAKTFPFQDSPFYGLLGIESPFGHNGPDTPVISVDEKDNGFAIRTELPGVAEEDLVIQVQDQRVTIAVKENESQPKENPTQIRGVPKSFPLGQRYKPMRLKPDWKEEF